MKIKCELITYCKITKECGEKVFGFMRNNKKINIKDYICICYLFKRMEARPESVLPPSKGLQQQKVIAMKMKMKTFVTNIV